MKHLNTLEAFKTFYYSPLRIENAIIPPMDLDIWAANNEDEPAKGWFGDQDIVVVICGVLMIKLVVKLNQVKYSS